MIVMSRIPSYVAEGDEDGDADTDVEGDGEADGDVETDVDGDGEADGEADLEAEGDAEGEVEGEVEAISVPRFPSRASQRYNPAEIVTEINDRKSLASANVACVSRATLYPAGAVTTMSPPPSVFIRRTKRMPGFVGVARVRVWPDAPEVISQICRSAVARMMPASPGSVNNFGPR